jgi:hypothetical protein
VIKIKELTVEFVVPVHCSYMGGTNFWGGTKEDDVSIFY